MADVRMKALRKHRNRPGFCIDTGAPTSVIGIKELRRIFGKFGRRLQGLLGSDRRFRFADAVFESLGRIDLPLATPNGIPTVFLSLDVVSADVPALLGFVLDHFSLTPDTVQNV